MSSRQDSASSTASWAGRSRSGSEALAERLAATFGAERNDSVQAQIKEIVTAEARQHREQLLQTLTAEDGTNPLVAMQVRINAKLHEAEERHRAEVEKLRESHVTQSRAMQGQVHELKENLARLLDKGEHELELADAEAAGTRKGLSFEERVHDAIEAIAASRGDVATHTGGEQAEGGGKKGDIVVEVGACEGSSQGTDRLRGQGQAAQQQRRLGGAQRGDGGAGGLLRRAGRGRRGERPGRSRAADRVRGQQADRRR